MQNADKSGVVTVVIAEEIAQQTSQGHLKRRLELSGTSRDEKLVDKVDMQVRMKPYLSR